MRAVPAAIAILIALLSALLAPVVGARILDTYEYLDFTRSPSSEKAYRYGNAHFGERSLSYDLAKARAYFLHAIGLGEHPLAYHQLSRIAFLEGHFDEALALVDIQLQKYAGPPNARYVRGLILGYMGRYEEAAGEYESYLESDPNNWAAVNDYAWVLLKAEHPTEALDAIEKVLPLWPENPWLLNSAAIAVHEIGDDAKARAYIARAAEHVVSLTEKDWHVAYPGNDPRSARDGVATLKRSILDNMHTIATAREDSAVQ